MIPIIAASAARNNSRNRYIYRGVLKTFDKCFIYYYRICLFFWEQHFINKLKFLNLKTF